MKRPFLNSDFTCLDVNECGRDNDCDSNAMCINQEGSYDCNCKEGYRGDGFSCTNICSEGGEFCHEKAACKLNETSHRCQCDTGYKGNGTYCDDIDECLDFALSCSYKQNKTCSNTDGSFLCDCLDGFSNHTSGSCLDIDECIDGNVCHQQASCTNTLGSFDCRCQPGQA